MSFDYRLIVGYPNEKSGFVYCLMHEEKNICKIGMSQGEVNRIQSLKSSIPLDLTHEIVPVFDRWEAENYLHRRFANRRRGRTEWFNGVTFDEFFTAIVEYKKRKETHYIDSKTFYQWLYNTEYEIKNGVHPKFHNLLKRRQINIMVFIDCEFKDKLMFREKMDYLLKDLVNDSDITLLHTANSHESLVSNYCHYNKSVNEYAFFPTYNYETKKHNRTAWENCCNAVNMSYGVVFFIKRSGGFINRLETYAKSKNVKIRRYVSDKTTGYTKEKTVTKNYYKLKQTV